MMFWKKKPPALKPAHRCSQVTLHFNDRPDETVVRPHYQRSGRVRGVVDGRFVRVQVSHEEYERDVTLNAYALSTVRAIEFGYGESQQ